MLRMLKLFFGLAVLTLGIERAAAFSFKGPFESYQVPTIGYVSGDLGGPHNLGEEYRRNVPVVYYTFDQTFWDYFGSNGVAAVEAAFAILNGVTNVSSYSPDLSEWPLEAQRFNYTAQALAITDLKSATLTFMMEQLGLDEPERRVWNLHGRTPLPPASCPIMGYSVVKRNFDPVPSALDVFQSSSYVNGTLYSYYIYEFCSGPTVLADAQEFPVDPLSAFSSIAGAVLPTPGSYFTGLTRDDIAGLRYLLRTNNVNTEDPGAGTLTVFTNFNVSQYLFTSNLTLLVNQALTNDAAALQALYPSLAIASSTPIFTNVVTTNVLFYFTNYPWLPAGTASLVYQTNRTTNVVTWYAHTFANVVTNTFYANGWVTVLTTNISTAACGPFAPVGTPPCTNVTLSTRATNFINGSYFILPTNSACGFSLVSTQIWVPMIWVSTGTNDAVIATNALGTVNNNGTQFSESLIFYQTNYAYVIHPVPCLTSNQEPRQGIEHVQFIRYDGAYDSLLDVYNYPITNSYTLVSVPLTNGVPTPRTILRPIRRPDIIITAMDMASDVSHNVRNGSWAFSSVPPSHLVYRRNLNWVPNNLFNLVGPGTIDPSLEMTFEKVGEIYYNWQPFGLDEITQFVQPGFNVWGSFDGTTNAPVVYPNGTSIQNYEQSVFINVLPPYLPPGYLTTTPQHTNYYSAQLSVTSYTPSFVLPATWSLAPGSPGLPPGLPPINPSTGVISGTPTMVGTFDFTVRVTDSVGRVFDRTYAITIAP